MEDKFSVLISVYFKEKPEYLEKALESITDKQTLKPNEIVLVKDGPLTKELDFIIKKYEDKYSNIFKVIVLEKNMGLGKALNIGLNNCSYELVARMDGDDISKAERFQKQLKLFKKMPELTVVGSLVDEFKEEGIIRSTRIVPENNEDIHAKLKTRCVFNHPTVMYKKSEVLNAGNYLQDFILEDYWLWIRMSIQGRTFYNIQESLIEFRITDGTSKRRGGIKLFISDFKFQKKLLEIKFINKKCFLKNIIIWGIYRLIPWKLREVLQKKIMRVSKLK